LDTTSVLASLSIFAKTDMLALRKRSIRLTAYLEFLLLEWPCAVETERPYSIITPASLNERGAQISVKLAGNLGAVMKSLEENGVVVDERKPDVIRISPAPLYNNFQDIWKCVNSLRVALGL
jgi:kynureninase